MMHKSGRNDKTTPGASVQDVTLGDYIARKSEPPKNKLTFDEWLHHRFPAGVGYELGAWVEDYLEECWKAAQENV